MSEYMGGNGQAEHNVRFSSENQEISPETSLRTIETLTARDGERDGNVDPHSAEEIKQLKTTLQNAVQSHRMEQYSFEPVSLPGSQPVSRVRRPDRYRVLLSVTFAHGYLGTLRHDHAIATTSGRLCSRLTTTFSPKLYNAYTAAHPCCNRERG